MVRLIRVRVDEFRVDPERIVVCGFSAGAHLCGSLGVHWKQVRDERYPVISNRPDGVILSYPVITSGEYAHRDSFVALLGEDAHSLRKAGAETLIERLNLCFQRGVHSHLKCRFHSHTIASL